MLSMGVYSSLLPLLVVLTNTGVSQAARGISPSTLASSSWGSKQGTQKDWSGEAGHGTMHANDWIRSAARAQPFTNILVAIFPRPYP